MKNLIALLFTSILLFACGSNMSFYNDSIEDDAMIAAFISDMLDDTKIESVSECPDGYVLVEKLVPRRIIEAENALRKLELAVRISDPRKRLPVSAKTIVEASKVQSVRALLDANQAIPQLVEFAARDEVISREILSRYDDLSIKDPLIRASYIGEEEHAPYVTEGASDTATNIPKTETNVRYDLDLETEVITYCLPLALKPIASGVLGLEKELDSDRYRDVRQMQPIGILDGGFNDGSATKKITQ